MPSVFVLKLLNNLNGSHVVSYWIYITVLKMSLVNVVCFLPGKSHFVVMWFKKFKSGLWKWTKLFTCKILILLQDVNKSAEEIDLNLNDCQVFCLNLKVCICLIKVQNGVSLQWYPITVQTLYLSNQYIFVPGHKGTFLSLGVQKCFLRGTNKRVEKCTNFKGTCLYRDGVPLERQSICTLLGTIPYFDFFVCMMSLR